MFRRGTDSGEDSSRVVEKWEDPDLANVGLIRDCPAESHVELARVTANLTEDHVLVEHRPSSDWYPVEPGAEPWTCVLADYWAEEVADGDPASLLSASFQFASLRKLRSELEDFDSGAWKGRERQRGREFESWMQRLAGAHYLDAELGTTHKGEQNDIYVQSEDHQTKYLVLCRWWSTSLQTRVVHELFSKTAIRPQGTTGVYVSMSPYTGGAYRALAERNVSSFNPTILLGSDDVHRLLNADVHFDELVSEKHQQLVERSVGP